MKNVDDRKTYQRIMLVITFLMGLLLGADDSLMSVLTRIYADGGEYGFFYYSLSENVGRSVVWGFIFSSLIAITHWLNYNNVDEASLMGVKVSVIWSIGYGLSSIATHGIIKEGVLIGAISAFCLILSAIVIDVSLKIAREKRQQSRSSIKVG